MRFEYSNERAQTVTVSDAIDPRNFALHPGQGSLQPTAGGIPDVFLRYKQDNCQVFDWVRPPPEKVLL